MIFVTLGTQDKSFDRLLNAIEKQIKKGVIRDKVIVQAGYSKFKSDNMQIFKTVSQTEFENYLREADLVITHGGVGNIMQALKLNKKIIAAARLSKFHEHTNDHQIQIVDKLAKEGYLLRLKEFDKLDALLKEIKTFNLKKYVSNNKYFCTKLKEEINKL